MATAALAAPGEAQRQRPDRQHITYFADTPDEINVFKVYGEQDGKTLMILGGIQGDEPGGFLSADSYADISLAKGNLIVVPRANFYSIILKHRGPDGDMNRQFGDPVTAQRHKKIVQVIKDLMAQSDLFLNLHDGSGFYRPTYEGPMANPRRFGQSLIADTAQYTMPDGRVLDLQGMAERVLARVNPRIRDSRYRMAFNNHRTASQDSIHKEQRRSATFYALTKCGVPAFGVETSKSLPNQAMKVRHHNLVINAFMEELGIEAMNPALQLAQPELKYIVVSVNGALPVVVTNESVLKVSPGDSINVLHLEANRERGLSCDVLGQGSVSDLRHEFRVDRGTDIVVRCDCQEIGRIRVLPSDAPSRLSSVSAPQLYFLIQALDRKFLVADGETLRLVKGDDLTVVDVLSNMSDRYGLEVNLKGYVPRGAHNSGEDRGYVVHTGGDLLPRYSRCGPDAGPGAECYQVVALKNNRQIGQMTVELAPATMDYLVVRQGQGPKRVYFNGETIKMGRGQVLEILDVKTNAAADGRLRLVLDRRGRRTPLGDWVVSPESKRLQCLEVGDNAPMRILVMRDELAIGEVSVELGEE